MTPRGLKNLSRRAAPIVQAIYGKHAEVFPAPHKGFYSVWNENKRKRFDVLKGTMMVGGLSAGEQPEWSDEPCWFALSYMAEAHVTKWDDEGNPLPRTRSADTPSQILAIGREMVEKLRR